MILSLGVVGFHGLEGWVGACILPSMTLFLVVAEGKEVGMILKRHQGLAMILLALDWALQGVKMIDCLGDRAVQADGRPIRLVALGIMIFFEMAK
jgi:UPF0716 family protein affecting phage T7 exclusion